MEKCSVSSGEHLSLFGKFFLKQTFSQMLCIIENENRTGGGIQTTTSKSCFPHNFYTGWPKYLELVSNWRYFDVVVEKIHHGRYPPLWEFERESHHNPNASNWPKSMFLVPCYGFYTPLCQLVGWLVGWLVSWLVGQPVGWPVDWLVGWLAGCLVSWSPFHFFGQQPQRAKVL